MLKIDHSMKLPKDWQWGVLGDAISQRREFITIADDKTYKRLKVQVHGNGIVLRDEVLGSQLSTKQQQLVNTNDFLVAEIDAKVGGFGIVPEELEGAIVSSHYFTFEINQRILLPGFLNAFITTGYITNEISLFVRGSLNYAAIRPKHVSAIPFPFASLPEQRKIIKQLENVNLARRAAETQLKEINALPSAILRRAFKGNS